jgi:SH3-like domain-containing protein
VVFLLLLLSLTVLYVKFETNKDMAVVVERVDSTFEPLKESTIHFRLSEGTKVKVLEEQQGWLKIRRGDGKVGWLPVEFVESI